MKEKWFQGLLACLLVLSLLLCSLPLTASADSYWLGDISKDDALSVTDVVLLRKLILQNTGITAGQFQRGDLNGDGKLTVTDVVLLRKNILAESGSSIETPFADLDATYQITSLFSGKLMCQTDSDGGFSQWTDVGAANQLWRAVPVEDGYYSLRAAVSNLALTVVDVEVFGSPMKMFRLTEYTGDPTQKWLLLPTGDGNWYLTAETTGPDCCMEISFAGLAGDNAKSDGWGVWMSDAITDEDFRKFSVVQATATDAPVEQATFDAAWAAGIYDTFMEQFRGEDEKGGAYFLGMGEFDFWQPAELTEMILDCYEATGDRKYLEDYEAFYQGFLNAHGTDWSSNNYNDDIMWMVISCCRAYALTGEDSYLQVAKQNFDTVYRRSYDDVLGGGIYWKYQWGAEETPGKNACINGPAAIAACYLAQVYGDTYLDYAKSLYAWERDSLFNPETGGVADNISTDGTLAEAYFTYNQGTFIGAATLLYQLTGRAAYLEDAKLAADYTIITKYHNGCINDERGGDFDGFKGIFVRWLYQYIDASGTADYQDWLALNITTGWSNRYSMGLVGTAWGALPYGDRLESAFSYGTYLSLIMPFDLAGIRQ